VGEEIAFENGRISDFKGRDLDLVSGHTAYSHASVIDLYLHTYSPFSSKSNKLFGDGQTDI